jgi:CDP-diacylglycerol--serine O-phosphatidyltransferase
MPTPAAAGTVLIPLLLAESKKLDLELPIWLIAAHTLLIAVLMVSKLPMFSFKHMKIRRSFAVPLLVLVGAVVVAGTRDPWLTLAGLSAVYLLLLPVSIVMGHRKLNRAPQSDNHTAPSRAHERRQPTP